MVVQPTLDIPAEIAARIDSGELFRIGGVVRDAATGRIVKLLDEISTSEAKEKSAQAVAQFAERFKDPRVYIPVVVFGTVVVAGVVGYAKWQRRKSGAPEVPAVPECVQQYNTSLRAYIDAIRERRLNLEILDRVLSDLDAVVNYTDPEGEIVLDFSTEHADTVLTIVTRYTEQLAEANDIDLTDLHRHSSSFGSDSIAALRLNLAVQKRIFTKLS